MSKQIKIYLDTSVINFLFAEDSPDYMKDTQEFFDKYIKLGIYGAYISDLVLEEIQKTKNENKRALLMNVFAEYPQISKLETNPEIDKEIKNLASKYIQEGVIPAKNDIDALHIATAVCFNFNYLISWNFKHLANINKEAKVLAVNFKNGYTNIIRIINPLNMMNNE